MCWTEECKTADIVSDVNSCLGVHSEKSNLLLLGTPRHRILLVRVKHFSKEVIAKLHEVKIHLVSAIISRIYIL